MRRRSLLLGAGAALLARPGLAQDGVKRVGYLTSQAENDPIVPALIEVWLQGLAEQGWEIGRNLAVEYRYGNADPALIEAAARELVAHAPDALLASTTPPTLAFKKLTSTIPIVFANVSDPIGSGFAQSFAHPGGNLTGCSNYEESVATKWMDLIFRLAPRTQTVGMMFNTKTAPDAGEFYWRPFAVAARDRGLQPVKVVVGTLEEIAEGTRQLAGYPNAALIVQSDSYEMANRAAVVAAANANRLPAIYPYPEFAQAGGLLSYAVDLSGNFHAAGQIVGRILHGEKPADLPVQGPTRFITTLNLATGRAQGITIPPDLLATATQVIE